jgi:ABC-type multidrug transport system ATPase subunit
MSDLRPPAGDGGGGDVLLAARDVSHAYRTNPVLRGVDIELRGGELVALLGPNGAGKTTLMAALVGLIEPTGGTISGSPRAAGWVPQGGATYMRLTVRENLVLFARLLHLEGDPAENAVHVARDAGLEPWLDHAGSELSGGLRQRLNVAVGLLGDPQVVVLDEPTTGVDLHHRHEMWRVLRSRAEHGRSVLYSTHSLEDASIADRVVMLAGGHVVYTGTLAGLAEHAPAASIDAHIPDTVEDPVARGMLALWGGDLS